MDKTVLTEPMVHKDQQVLMDKLLMGIRPAGADGQDGADGAQGPAGADGQDGADGAQGPQDLMDKMVLMGQMV